jgi:hypothetical protein
MDDVVKKVSGEFIGFVDVHVFVAFLHVVDIAVYSIQHEPVDIEFRCNIAYFLWKEA